MGTANPLEEIKKARAAVETLEQQLVQARAKVKKLTEQIHLEALKKKEAIDKELELAGVGYVRKPRACSICHKAGHWSSNCPSKPSKPLDLPAPTAVPAPPTPEKPKGNLRTV